ncbi:MAG: hypothetical protein RR880_03885, partial [Bacteroidales bacterium]
EDGGLTMAELSQIMEYVNSYTGSAGKFKRGVVFDPSIGKRISVTIVATGFDMHNLPQINMEEEQSNRVILGNSGIYSSGEDNTTSGKNSIVINEIQSQNFNNESDDELNVAEQPATPESTYVRHKGKPALILEPGYYFALL